ncbi:MAG: alpha-ketoglutarate-dependent dioxygenase AlkB [Halobacteriovoraceae bacterium]|nr:alpha-ketoglutarate-dependent dioxygenase AlkB [Halobacteriovoraceae bacterium]|tara:strand:- start:12253 stop:12849 length:597 start_codon:yes stop_codon:yes gene_type:complete
MKAKKIKKNLLPQDGAVYYHGTVFDQEYSDRCYNYLYRYIKWENDTANIFGKKIITKRKVAWYGDKPYQYTYSKSTKTAHPWTPKLKEIKRIIEEGCQKKFNSCLLNLYHSGEEGMAWHSDAEKDLEKHGVIASLSLGAERRFCFKHKNTKEVICQVLEHGSLLTMESVTQDFWQHRLPPTRKVNEPRINLTFRNIVT